MAAVKFVTAKGSTKFALNPFYVAYVQHDRTMGRREAYDFLAEATGYKAAAIRAVFMGLKQYIRANAGKGNITYLDEVASFRNVVRGGFESNVGPWVKGKNHLQVIAVEMDPFKSVLADIVPTNKTEGAKPTIYTVLDETTREYDIITGTDEVSIAGADLAPDTTKDDEYIALVDKDGVETKASRSATCRTSSSTSPPPFPPARTRSSSRRARGWVLNSAWRAPPARSKSRKQQFPKPRKTPKPAFAGHRKVISKRIYFVRFINPTPTA